MDLSTVKAWQRTRATALHNAFLAADARRVEQNLSVAQVLSDLIPTLRGFALAQAAEQADGAKPLRVSLGMLKDNWRRWNAGGRLPTALLLGYGKHIRRVMPPELIRELHRRATLPGMAHISVVEKSLHLDWAAGRPVPGLGTWQDWYAAEHPSQPLPSTPPDFPFSSSALYKHQPTKAERALGNRGMAAFKMASSHVTLDYSKLRRCELFVLDDVRIDVLVIDDATGQPVELMAYIMMEVASRFVPGFVLKPAARIKAEDVDELLAHTLSTTGIGRDYVTHIKFERGTVACSEAAQTLLEAASEGRLKIHRTSMDGGVRWVGAAPDKATGHWMGKAVIESFMRKLHLALMGMPAQRGSTFRHAPANLEPLAKQASALATFALAASHQPGAQRVKLHLPMLYLSEFEAVFRQAINRHNTEPGHDYQGHATHLVAETQPGVWQQPTRS